MMTEVEILDFLAVVAFLALIYIAGQGTRLIRLSPIFGEVLVGLFFGPEVLDLLQEKAEWFSLLGYFGLLLLVFESGMDVNIKRLKQHPLDSFLVAAVGIGLSYGTSLLWAYFFGWSVFPTGAALGAVAIPTSAGVTFHLLKASQRMCSPVGQVLMVSVVIGDIVTAITLRTLSLVSEGFEDEPTAWNLIYPILFAVVFTCGAGLLAVCFFPFVLAFMNTTWPQHRETLHKAHVLLMVTVLVLYTWIGSLFHSHLLGPFMAGLSFSLVPNSIRRWEQKTKNMATWLLRLFFSCTVAFAVPLTSGMLRWGPFWRGFIFALGPMVGARLFSSLFLPDPCRWTVGMTMIGRADYSLIVANTLYKLKWEDTTMLTKDTYSTVCWAVLWSLATVLVLYRWRCHRDALKFRKTNIHAFTLKVQTKMHKETIHVMLDELWRLRYVVSDVLTDRDSRVAYVELLVRPQDPTRYLDTPDFNLANQAVFKVLEDKDALIQIEGIRGQVNRTELACNGGWPAERFYLPAKDIDPNPAVPDDVHRSALELDMKLPSYFLVMRVMCSGPDCYTAFVNIYKIIVTMLNVDVYKCKLTTKGDTSVIVFYGCDMDTPTHKPCPPARMENIRRRLGSEFNVLNVTAKHLVELVRREDVPNMYGFSPLVPDNYQVAYVGVYNEHQMHAQVQLLTMLQQNRLCIINATMDYNKLSGFDQVSLFVRHVEQGVDKINLAELNGAVQVVYEQLQLPAKHVVGPYIDDFNKPAAPKGQPQQIAAPPTAEGVQSPQPAGKPKPQPSPKLKPKPSPQPRPPPNRGPAHGPAGPNAAPPPGVGQAPKGPPKPKPHGPPGVGGPPKPKPNGSSKNRSARRADAELPISSPPPPRMQSGTSTPARDFSSAHSDSNRKPIGQSSTTMTPLQPPALNMSSQSAQSVSHTDIVIQVSGNGSTQQPQRGADPHFRVEAPQRTGPPRPSQPRDASPPKLLTSLVTSPPNQQSSTNTSNLTDTNFAAMLNLGGSPSSHTSGTSDIRPYRPPSLAQQQQQQQLQPQQPPSDGRVSPVGEPLQPHPHQPGTCNTHLGSDLPLSPVSPIVQTDQNQSMGSPDSATVQTFHSLYASGANTSASSAGLATDNVIDSDDEESQ
eukprot:TRINITY_DN66091_c3_g1_i1.p1 TRINITY_DN66091_c3_g1~~TRINITY_DN66091_c3_g1_i1.p1  ORF type:complete len:1123 (+),score=63.84 TRINITY_DN66091_c3_g1_i1:67-3435(+)